MDYKKECEKRKVGPSEIKKVEKIQHELNWKYSFIAIGILVVFVGLEVIGIRILQPFPPGIKNLQWMGMVFSLFATFLFIKGGFKNKYQIALETATLLGGNDFSKESMIRQKTDFAWGLYMLMLSVLTQGLYILLST